MNRNGVNHSMLKAQGRTSCRVASPLLDHPGLITTDSVDILDGRTGSTPLHEVYGYKPGMGLPSAADRDEIVRLMTARGRQGGSATPSASAAG